MRTLRVTGSNAQKQQIQLTVPSNTTLLGTGRDAALLGVYLTVNTGRNIVIRNLRFEAPTDHFPSWDPGDGATGAWNARFDALSVVTGRNIWIEPLRLLRRPLPHQPGRRRIPRQARRTP
nr:hypothetical protein [Streptomyces himastatinicus]